MQFNLSQQFYNKWFSKNASYVTLREKVDLREGEKPLGRHQQTIAFDKGSIRPKFSQIFGC